MATQTAIQNTARPARQPVNYKTITVNGAEVAYVERGSGDAVIFVHGSISDLRIWEKQMDAFSENHRAIAYSRRFAWPNTEVSDGVDDQMQPHVDDLAELIQRLEAAPAHLVGNSWGGFICLLTALQHPELVSSITVEEPPVIPLFVGTRPNPRRVLSLLLTHPRRGVALVKFFRSVLGPAISAFKKGDRDGGVQAFARGVLGADYYEVLPADLKEAMLANGKALSSQLLGAGFPSFTESDARAVKTPTLLVSGEESPALLRQLIDRLAEIVPGAQRADIIAASHIMHYQEPAALNRAVLDFIGQQ